MLNINELIKLAENYNINVSETNKGSGGIFYIDLDGNKQKISPEDYTEDMKSIDFMMSHGFIVADSIVGNIKLGDKINEGKSNR